MLLDSAKGLEAADAEAVRRVPQPGRAGDHVREQVGQARREPLELLDEIEQRSAYTRPR